METLSVDRRERICNNIPVKLTYFKQSGKYYTHEKTYMRASFLGSDDAIEGIANMNDICQQVRQMNEEGKLPGLNSGRWLSYEDGAPWGFILVTCKFGYPCLIHNL